MRYHELLLAMKKEIFNDECYESLNHAIALSQRGQVYAFLEDNRAEEDFLSALYTMDFETPDRLITESYLLHYYISSGNRERYEEYAKEYFEGRTVPEEQFDYLIRAGVGANARFSLKYALFVWVKALHTFYLDSVPASLIDKIKDIEMTLTVLKNGAEKQINGHPWEMIYKYLVLIMLKYNEPEAAEVYINKLQAVSDGSAGIIKDIATESLGICKAAKEGCAMRETGAYTYMYI